MENINWDRHTKQLSTQRFISLSFYELASSPFLMEDVETKRCRGFRGKIHNYLTPGWHTSRLAHLIETRAVFKASGQYNSSWGRLIQNIKGWISPWWSGKRKQLDSSDSDGIENPEIIGSQKVRRMASNISSSWSATCQILWDNTPPSPI
jgi:hypothetical protein